MAHAGDIKLECEVEGEPKPTVSWFRNTYKIEASNAIKIQVLNFKPENIFFRFLID